MKKNKKGVAHLEGTEKVPRTRLLNIKPEIKALKC
jgi:hypothetical protein